MENGDKRYEYPGAPLLNVDSIRLLKILGASHEDQPVACTLETADLSAKPQFSALSYTWGPALHSFARHVDDSVSEDLSHHILLNGQPFTVTENLFDVLRELRRSGVSDFFWIDAVCISQQDLSERSQQVANMGRIYGAAQNVIVWLGKDEVCLEELKWATDTLLPTIKERPMDYLTTGIMADEAVVALESKVVRAMRFVADRRWFCRAWIVQEIALSKAVRVLCGRSEISWEDFVIFHKVLGLSEWGALLPQHLDGEERREAYWTARNSIERFQDVRNHLKVHGLPQNRTVSGGDLPSFTAHPGVLFGDETELEQAAAWLAYLVALVREQDCAVKQDKIYSVLGIAACFSTHTNELVRPDYSFSVPEVYKMAGASFLLQNRYLSALGHVGDLGQRSHADLPSWAADYSTKPVSAPLTHLSLSKDRRFDASAARSSKRFPRAIQGDKLSLYGAPFDEVSHVLTMTVDDIIGSKCEIEEFVAFGGSLPLRYVNGQNMVECIWRTFIFDIGKSDDFTPVSPAPNSYRQSFTAWWITQCTVWLARHADEEGVWAPHPAIRFLCQLFDPETRNTLVTNDFKLAITHLCVTQTTLKEDLDAFDKYRREMMPFTEAYKMKIDGRRLFRTRNNFVGLGTLSVQPGDQVWLIRDSLVPLILRQAKDTDAFILVGEAYLHGFMYGEMLEPRWGMEEKFRGVTIT